MSQGLIKKKSIESLKARVNLAQHMGQFHKLHRKGGQYALCCPFHAEKTPSCYIYDEHYHCFGCNAHGDVIAFEMHRSGASFEQAVQTLGMRYNITIEFEKSHINHEERERQQLSLKVLEALTNRYHRFLLSARGQQAIQYLEQRKLGREGLSRWGIGLSPPGNVLEEVAKKEGWPAATLQENGLVRQYDSGQSKDFFQDRIMIPIHNDKGQVVAFGGRLYARGSRGPKYLNSPETKLFNKSSVLFNYFRARPHIRKQNFVVVVEGYMDCIALAEAGVENVVAVMGTALTQRHLRLLEKQTKQVVVCFDSDAAGQRAALRSFEVGFPFNLVDFYYMETPGGKDPDEFVKAQGVETFLKLAHQAMTGPTLLRFLVAKALHNINDAAQRVRVVKDKIVPILLANPDAIQRETALKEVARFLDISNWEYLGQGVKKRDLRQEPHTASPALQTATDPEKTGAPATSPQPPRQGDTSQAQQSTGTPPRKNGIDWAVLTPWECEFVLGLFLLSPHDMPPELISVVLNEAYTDRMEALAYFALQEGISPQSRTLVTQVIRDVIARGQDASYTTVKHEWEESWHTDRFICAFLGQKFRELAEQGWHFPTANTTGAKRLARRDQVFCPANSHYLKFRVLNELLEAQRAGTLPLHVQRWFDAIKAEFVKLKRRDITVRMASGAGEQKGLLQEYQLYTELDKELKSRIRTERTLEEPPC